MRAAILMLAVLVAGCSKQPAPPPVEVDNSRVEALEKRSADLEKRADAANAKADIAISAVTDLRAQVKSDRNFDAQQKAREQLIEGSRRDR